MPQCYQAVINVTLYFKILEEQDNFPQYQIKLLKSCYKILQIQTCNILTDSLFLLEEKKMNKTMNKNVVS